MAIPTLTETLDTMYVTTWVLRNKDVVDNIHEAIPFYYWMMKKGRHETRSGGRRIEVPLRYAKNSTPEAIGRGGSVALVDTDVLTPAYYEWKYITGHILRYFVDFQKNRGPAELMSKVNADIDGLRDGLIDKFETDLFGDGTGDNGLTIGGLQLIVDTTPATGTVGGINAATRAYWRNQATNMTGLALSTYLVDYMSAMFNDCGQWGEGVSRFPDFIVTTDTICESYEQEALEVYRINDNKLADMGFGDLAYKSRPMTWSPSAPSYSMFMLNSKHLKWTTDDIEYLNLGEFESIPNQPRDRVAHSMSVCNLVCDNRRKQGVLYNIGN